MTFEAIDDLLVEHIDLPIHGKTYRVLAVDWPTQLWVEDKWNAGVEAARSGVAPPDPDATRQSELFARLLGPALEQMTADQVAAPTIKLAALTSLFWTVHSKDIAEQFWAAAGRPEGSTPNREQRRQASKGSGSKTRSPASSSGTRVSAGSKPKHRRPGTT